MLSKDDDSVSSLLVLLQIHRFVQFSFIRHERNLFSIEISFFEEKQIPTDVFVFIRLPREANRSGE